MNRSMPLVLLGALALCACAPREWLLPKAGIEPPSLRDFPADFESPVSHATGRPMPGFGGSGAAQHTPVIFVHGNTVSARYWLPNRAHFAAAGYKPSELWALGYGWDNVRWFDSNDLSVASLDRIVDRVTGYISAQSGRPIRQVDIVAHSLGVTVTRQWMKQTNSWHRVRNFVAACGANDGVWTAGLDTRGQNRTVAFELAPDGPWLAQLNRGGETPGATRTMTLYDGNGWSDVLFPAPHAHSPALDGAVNRAWNLEHGTHYDHLELPRRPETMDAMIAFLRAAPEPLPQVEPPRILREGDQLRAEPAQARLHCAAGGAYPDDDTPAVATQALADGELLTCYAHDPRSHLSSPMARWRRDDHYTPAGELTLRAEPAGGVFDQPQSVTLTANDPGAFIVYSTAGVLPDSGAPLYQAPVYVAAPLTLIAVAIAPDGRRSEPLRLVYDISLEYLEARHSLQRQFHPDTPIEYEGKRKKGR
jgi:triacylglycerol lipase